MFYILSIIDTIYKQFSLAFNCLAKIVTAMEKKFQICVF